MTPYQQWVYLRGPKHVKLSSLDEAEKLLKGLKENAS